MEIETSSHQEIRHYKLQKVKKYTEDGREIFYTDDMSVDANLTFIKCWQNNDGGGILQTI
jgi:hypothetical protein